MVGVEFNWWGVWQQVELAELNPIKHLWALLERRIRTHTITSKEMLKTVILDEWSKMSTEDTRKLVHSIGQIKMDKTDYNPALSPYNGFIKNFYKQ